MSSWSRLVAVSLFVTGSSLSSVASTRSSSCNADAKGNNDNKCNATEAETRVAKWAPKWKAGPNKAGWHIGQQVHPRLAEFEDKLLPTPAYQNYPARVLIPLAGKSHDVAYLARRGHKVVAVEGITEAIDEFEKEYSDKSLLSKSWGQVYDWLFPPPFNLTSNQSDSTRFRLQDARHVHVKADGGLSAGRSLWLQGDFLLLAQPPKSSPVLGWGGEQVCSETEPSASFDAVFDRGGFVAVDKADRQAYAATLTRLVAPFGRVLMVAVEHPPFTGGGMGPPFSVDADAIRTLFGDSFDIEVLKHEDRLPVEPVWAERGCAYFNEVTYLLTRKSAKG